MGEPSGKWDGGPHPLTLYFIALHSNIGFRIFVRLLQVLNDVILTTEGRKNRIHLSQKPVKMCVVRRKSLPVLWTMVSIPRRAKGAPSVGMTDLKAYDTTNDFNKTSIFTLNLEAPFNHFPVMARLYKTLHY